MARKLSKKKISGWLLLFAVIIFFRCGGYEKTKGTVKSLSHNIHSSLPTPSSSLPDIPIDASLAQRLDSFVVNNVPAGTLGIYVWDETAGKEVYARNPDRLMAPASNMKMLTCLAALRRFGPNGCYESGAYINGEMKADTLIGDIALKFTSDPYMNNEKLAHLVDAFRQRGIHRVKGRVVLDLKILEPMQHEEHWIVGDLRRSHLGMLYKGEQRMRNEVKYALRTHGVNFSDDQIVVASVPKGSKRIAQVRTPMRNSIFRALQNSSNEHAECLNYALSDLFRDGPDLRKSGARYLRNFVATELGSDPDAVCRIHDGSGLCIHDRLSPRFLVRMLHYAYGHKYIYKMLRSYLPVSGKTGTLHDRMYKPYIRGRVQAKTGTLTREGGITSLSGYVTGANGHLLLFGIIQNECPVADARLWQNKFCEQFVK